MSSSEIDEKIRKENSKSDDNTADTSIKLGMPKFPFSDIWVHGSLPLDIGWSDFRSLSVPPLIWMESNKIPLDMTIANTGNTLNVHAEYSGKRPSLIGSVLRCPYEFWCYHFHWGTKFDEGSEHRVLGKRFPMEIHLVFYNISYLNTDKALNGNDGLLILVYMCKLENSENLILKNLTSNLTNIETSGKSTNVKPFALSSLFDCNLKNYLMYWGAMENNPTKPIIWMISSKPVSANESQLSCMRSLRRPDDKCILSNCRSFRTTQPCKGKVFNIIQPACTVKSLMMNIEDNNVKMLTSNRSDKTQGKFGTTVTRTARKKPPIVPTRRNVVNAVKVDVLPQSVGKSTIPNHIKSEKNIKSNSPTNSQDLENKPEPNERVEVISEIWEDIANDVLSRYEVKETKALADDMKPEKHIVIRSIDNLLTDLTKDTRETDTRPKVIKTHREGVRMNSTALRREEHIKERLQKIIEYKSKNVL